MSFSKYTHRVNISQRQFLHTLSNIRLKIARMGKDSGNQTAVLWVVLWIHDLGWKRTSCAHRSPSETGSCRRPSSGTEESGPLRALIPLQHNERPVGAEGKECIRTPRRPARLVGVNVPFPSPMSLQKWPFIMNTLDIYGAPTRL